MHHSLPDTSFIAPQIGNSQIDHEHEQLIFHVQKLRQLSGSQICRDEFFDMLSQLGRELSGHYANEEALMTSLGMPENLLAPHVRAHKKIIEQYTELNIDLMNGKQFDTEQLIQMVHKWIVEHIMAYDMKIKPFIQDESTCSSTKV